MIKDERIVILNNKYKQKFRNAVEVKTNLENNFKNEQMEAEYCLEFQFLSLDIKEYLQSEFHVFQSK